MALCSWRAALGSAWSRPGIAVFLRASESRCHHMSPIAAARKPHTPHGFVVIRGAMLTVTPVES
jgi:hypothetical protein